MTKATASPRGPETTGILRPRTGLALARVMKQEREKQAAESKAGLNLDAAASVAAITTASALAADQEEPERSELESTESAAVVEFHDETPHTEVVHGVLHDEPEESHAELGVVDKPEEAVEPDHKDSSTPPLGERDTGAVSILAPVADSPIPSSDQVPEERLDEAKPSVRSGFDIEDIVNLLESGVSFTTARPPSIASIPDEYVAEIPDEE
jgi:hypothetical protein